MAKGRLTAAVGCAVILAAGAAASRDVAIPSASMAKIPASITVRGLALMAGAWEGLTAAAAGEHPED